MSQPPAKTTIISQPLVAITIASQSLERMTVIVRSMDLVVKVWSTLRSQENRKVRKRLSPKNQLKNSQKVGIHLILILQKPAQAS